MSLSSRRVEQRAFGRRETLIHAMARIGGRAPEPCVVRNLSDGGARLEFNGAVELPAIFRLVIEAKGFDAECAVRRQDGNVVGVEFVGVGAGRTLSDPPAPKETAASSVSPSTGGKPPGSKFPNGVFTAVSGKDVRRQLFGAT